jgi:hypothetical protein
MVLEHRRAPDHSHNRGVAMAATDDTSNPQSTPNRDRRKAPLTPDVSAETSSLRDQAISAERRMLMHVHSLLHCLSECCCTGTARTQSSTHK